MTSKREGSCNVSSEILVKLEFANYSASMEDTIKKAESLFHKIETATKN